MLRTYLKTLLFFSRSNVRQYVDEKFKHMCRKPR